MKHTLYFLNKDNAFNPFACDDNTSFIGRITYNCCDLYLYLDDVGQQMFIRFQKYGVWREYICSAYNLLGLIDIVMFIHREVRDLYMKTDIYLNDEYETKGDEWPHGI